MNRIDQRQPGRTIEIAPQDLFDVGIGHLVLRGLRYEQAAVAALSSSSANAVERSSLVQQTSDSISAALRAACERFGTAAHGTHEYAQAA